MGKSVYSLVLMDEVVEGIDRAAYLQGTSRSNMINRILAEYLAYATPETRARTVVEQMEALLRQSTRLSISNLTDSSLSLRSALSYKYNPTMRYTVELRLQHGEGVLRAALRTQNQALIAISTDFFTFWQALELRYLSPRLGYMPQCALGEGKYERLFRLQAEEAQNYGEAIATYVEHLDQALKLYLANAANIPQARTLCERYYLQKTREIPAL